MSELDWGERIFIGLMVWIIIGSLIFLIKGSIWGY